MDIKELYKSKLISLDDAVRKVKSDDEIAVGLGGAEAAGFLSNLHKAKGRVENVSVITCLNMGNYEFCSNPDMRGHFLNETWFYSGLARGGHKFGTASLIPSHLHLAAKKRLDYKKPNIFVGSVSPMDNHGYFSLSLSVSYEREYLENADMVILEVNQNLPRTYGDTAVHVSEADFIYEHNTPVIELPVVEPSEKDLVIGNYIAELIEDGSTLQLGIGGIPNAVAKSLENKRDLGVHTEMFTDGIVDLYNLGVVTNRRKTINKNKFTASFALGTKKLYDFVDNNLCVEFKSASYTNDPYIIGQNYKMVSINTSMQVDLTGQCCSESIGFTQYSGTGGQADTAIGAQNSFGGKSIIALYSTAKGESISTIVPFPSTGAVVSLSRNDVDYVVTEYGVASLRGRSIRERVRELINIAHPNFREDLKREAERNYIW
ncbi:MAG: acetyl-CoA hydrolase/transferase C-terminal domain-containing protein [Bacillota bacterium]|nr:acetyl-CoA hydrolase/transferase C-terminal domain-containing protein [Bacillota bacterium]